MAFEPQGPAVNHERIQFSSGERNRAADSPEYTVLLPTRGACSPYSPGTPKKNCSSRSRSSRNRIRTPMWSVYRSSSFSARPSPLVRNTRNPLCNPRQPGPAPAASRQRFGHRVRQRTGAIGARFLAEARVHATAAADPGRQDASGVLERPGQPDEIEGPLLGSKRGDQREVTGGTNVLIEAL